MLAALDLKVCSALSSYVILGKSLHLFGASVASSKTKKPISWGYQSNEVGTFLSMAPGTS